MNFIRCLIRGILTMIVCFSIGYYGTALVFKIIKNFDRTNRKVSKWVNHWILCPNHFGDPIETIIKSWIWDYPHDFCIENKMIFLCKLGFHDWDYTKTPESEFPEHLMKAPCTYSAICKTCGTSLFEGQFGEFDFKKIITERSLTK